MKTSQLDLEPPWSICWRAGLSLGFSMPNSRPDRERCQEKGQPDSPCLTPAESLSPGKADRHLRWVSAASGLMLNSKQLKKHQWFVCFFWQSPLQCGVKKEASKSAWSYWKIRLGKVRNKGKIPTGMNDVRDNDTIEHNISLSWIIKSNSNIVKNYFIKISTLKL